MRKNTSLKEKILLATSILLMLSVMLSGVLLMSPRAFAQTPALAKAVEANPLSITWNNTVHKVGDEFVISIDVVNVTNLFSFGSGFYFNATYLKVVTGSVVEGGFLSDHGANALAPSPVVINNTAGWVSCGWSLYDPNLSPSGSGHLFNVTLQLISLPPLNVPVEDARLTETNYDPAQTVLIYNDGYSLITPPANDLLNGTFELIPAVPEFSSIFLATLLVLATLAATLFSVATRSRKRKS